MAIEDRCIYLHTLSEPLRLDQAMRQILEASLVEQPNDLNRPDLIIKRRAEDTVKTCLWLGKSSQ